MIRRLSALAAACLALAAPAFAAPPPAPAAAPDYSRDASWLCLPGRADPCALPLATAALEPDGFGPVVHSVIAKDPPIDCFYVYPTVSHDEGDNSDLSPAADEERLVVQSQFARFVGVCRPFAPLYRQMTVGAVAELAMGGKMKTAAEIAYGDVAAAWADYLGKRNQQRRFVLIGHSQGSAMLIELIRHQIEGKPIARQMVMAIIPGYHVLVPQGKLVGGSFRSTPLCSRPDETGCVIAYTSYRENNAPPEGAMFGHAGKPGMTVGCVNPAKPGSRQWEALGGYWPATSDHPVPGGDIIWSSAGEPPATWLKVDGLVSGRCVNDGQRGYLSLRVNADPKDARTDRIGGEVGLLGFFLPGWGMHLADVNAAQGDLLRLVEATEALP